MALAIVVGACTSNGAAGPNVTAPPATLPLPTADSFGLDPDSYEMRAARLLVACMEEQGFSGTVTSDGGVRIDPAPPGQEQRRDQVVDECANRVREELPPEPEPTTEAEWRRRYDEQVETARCLARYGLVSDIPSFESWMESRGANWTAYDAVGQVSKEEWFGLNQACPQP